MKEIGVSADLSSWGGKIKKNLYRAKVLNFVPYGGKVIIYWVYAFSKKQAVKIIAEKFNKEYKFDPERNFVDMKVEEIKVFSLKARR